MINLLTPEAQASLRRQYIRRRRVVASGMILFCLISILALASTILLQLQVKSNEIQTKLDAQTTSDEDVQQEQDLKQINAELALLRSRGSEPAISDLLSLVSDMRPSGITISSWSFSAPSSAAVVISLKGQARDRSTLLAFESALRNSDAFASVDSPVSNLIKNQNGDFSITLTVKYAQ
jgi:hypothetical protein